MTREEARIIAELSSGVGEVVATVNALREQRDEMKARIESLEKQLAEAYALIAKNATPQEASSVPSVVTLHDITTASA